IKIKLGYSNCSLVSLRYLQIHSNFNSFIQAVNITLLPISGAILLCGCLFTYAVLAINCYLPHRKSFPI
ncbi:MAG: hypothetical protein ABIM21_06090, partial [candidate division WOR-3 bacterium]